MRLHFHILSLMLILFLSAVPAGAEHAPIGIAIPLPENYTILNSLWLTDTQADVFLLLGNSEENAVKLAAATRLSTGQYLLTSLSKTLLPLDTYDPELAYMTVDWHDGTPFFWWGTSNVIHTRDFYLHFDKDASLGWIVRYGYVDDPFTPLKYSFSTEEPGILAVSGEVISPEIYWLTDFPMTLDGFSLERLEDVCLEALTYLEEFNINHNVGDQDENYYINWW